MFSIKFYFFCFVSISICDIVYTKMYLFCRFSLMPQILSACNNCFTTLNNNCQQKKKKIKKKKEKRINTVWFCFPFFFLQRKQYRKTKDLRNKRCFAYIYVFKCICNVGGVFIMPIVDCLLYISFFVVVVVVVLVVISLKALTRETGQIAS